MFECKRVALISNLYSYTEFLVYILYNIYYIIKSSVHRGDIAMSKVMFSLPNQLVARMKAAIPSRERSKVAAFLLEREISAREHKLYLCAKELEACSGLKEEAATWDKEF